ncbi:MAG: response regulator [Deltaproteobacteria bacterium]|nr:response regulator [Deltaproteobacteria bacterium]
MPRLESELPAVLVVDDSESNLDLLVGALGEAYALAVAMDGPTALQAVAESPPDLILLDIMMPGMDGYEVLRRLQADPRSREIPVIFLTGMTEVADKTKGFELGARDYITKPFEIAEVRARVDTHLQLRAAYAEVQEQNRQLKDYARLRDEVERITHHDLKTPLNALMSVPELLLDEPNLTADQRDMLRLMRESATRMLHLINRSLDLYKMELGRYQLCPEPVEVVRLIQEIWTECRELVLAKGLSLHLLRRGQPVSPHERFWVRGEDLLVYSLLANLIKNAVEASPPGAALTISLVELQAGQLIRLHNQGAVPAALRGTFFDKFTTAGKKGGTGLGAYTARLIAQTLGGSLAMTTSVGEGTLLSVTLPPAPPGEIAAAETGATGGEAPAASPGSGGIAPAPARGAAAGGWDLGILVVDDYANMRRLTKSILHRLGFKNLYEAANGHEALDVLRTRPIGLVISDVNMPELNGLELLHLIRSDPEMLNLPFILTTGEADRGVILAAAKAKVTEYILKPFSPEVLQAKLAKALKGRVAL